MKFIKEYILPTAISVVAAFLFVHFVIQLNVVSGESMLPTFHDGDIVFSEKVSYYFSEPEINDIVLVETDSGIVVKRVIAKGNSVVEFVPEYNESGVAYFELVVDGEVIEEEYINEPMQYTTDLKFELKEGEYFVLGDNRNASSDSRSFGSVTEEEILSRVFFNIHKFKLY